MKIDEEKIKALEKIGYRFVGTHKHSAIKVCNWTKQSIRENGVCYKEKFYKKLYGIESHRCLQMSPSVFNCTHKCQFCWRNTDITFPKWFGEVDDPKEVLDESINAHKEILQGFGGSFSANKSKFYEALNPKNVAISLAGEPTLYPKISELISEIKSRNMTAFLVSNGTLPNVLEKIEEPTQLYITLPAPNKDIYEKTCQPLISNGWEMLQKSLSLLNSFSCNTAIRLTLVKNLNFVYPEKYAKIIEKANPTFLEVKAFMSVGFSRQRLPYSAMPLHEEIREFAKSISNESGYEIKDEQKESRVVLLTR